MTKFRNFIFICSKSSLLTNGRRITVNEPNRLMSFYRRKAFFVCNVNLQDELLRDIGVLGEFKLLIGDL